MPLISPGTRCCASPPPPCRPPFTPTLSSERSRRGRRGRGGIVGCRAAGRKGVPGRFVLHRCTAACVAPPPPALPRPRLPCPAGWRTTSHGTSCGACSGCGSWATATEPCLPTTCCGKGARHPRATWAPAWQSCPCHRCEERQGGGLLHCFRAAVLASPAAHAVAPSPPCLLLAPQEARGLDAGDRLAKRLVGMGDNRTAAIVWRIAEEERAHVAVGERCPAAALLRGAAG